MADGRWEMEDGGWDMEDGKWRMENGVEWRVGHLSVSQRGAVLAKLLAKDGLALLEWRARPRYEIGVENRVKHERAAAGYYETREDTRLV